MTDKTNRLKARLPRGLADRGPAEIAATRRMIDAIRDVYERYGFEPVETPAIEYTDALGKFLPDQDRPNEGVFSFQDDDEQWLSLRYDLTAPLARYVAENFDALPKPYRSYRYGWVFRNEKPGPGRFRQFMQFDADTVGSALAGRRRRDLHDGGRHDGGARHSARQLRGEGEQPQGARWRDGGHRPWRRGQCRASGSPCCARSTSSIGLGADGVRASARRRTQGRERRFHKRRRARRPDAIDRVLAFRRRRKARTPTTRRLRTWRTVVDRTSAQGEAGVDELRADFASLIDVVWLCRRPHPASIPPSSAASNTTPARSTRLNCCSRPRTRRAARCASARSAAAGATTGWCRASAASRCRRPASRSACRGCRRRSP